MTRINREMVPKFFAFAFELSHALHLARNDTVEMNMAHDKLAQVCFPVISLGTGKAGNRVDLHVLPLAWHSCQ